MIPELTLNAWMRFDHIRRAVASAEPERILEIGPGQGAMGAWLATKADYTGVELDPTSRAVAVERLGHHGTVVDQMPDGEFDLVCAFEVLEHIEDDCGALAEWRGHLREGGTLLLSVPAHQRRWGASDELAGHFRRYERDQLRGVAEAAGYVDARVLAQGFPIGYLLEQGKNRIAERRLREAPSATIAERTASSGRHLQVRGLPARGLAAAALPFRLIQWPFASTERATGWVLVATRA